MHKTRSTYSSADAFTKNVPRETFYRARSQKHSEPIYLRLAMQSNVPRETIIVSIVKQAQQPV